MNLFFEEDGAFKAGVILNATDAAYQIELPTGKRIKVKKITLVFFEFSAPSPLEFIQQAQAVAETIDLDLLWEFAAAEEFTYQDAAKEYFGEEAGKLEQAGTLFRLHAYPVYFYRKGRGKYRAAPEETLKLALAAIERKRKLDEQKDAYVKELLEGRAPEAIAAQAIQLLSKPDKNSIEWKALKEATDIRSCSPLRLLLEVKAIPNAWRYHVENFFSINFPKGKEFPKTFPEPQKECFEDLPLADGQAFSIDDSNTTEIDDAVSVTPVGDNRTKLGIHISAPGLGILTDSEVDKAARERMSTVYAPGLKTTMLPKSWVKAFSLDEGNICPVLSLYALVDNETFEVVVTETRLERIKIAANLWYDKIESQVTEEAVRDNTLDIPFGKEMSWVWHFAKHLQQKREEVRGRPEPVGKIDWYFDLKGEDENATVELKGRKRGAPLDLLVAEVMIFANASWGEWLEKKKVAGIYRSQRMGKVKMTSVPGPHDGIGVEYYAWSTSPLRRYVDMVNQRQLIAAVRDEKPPFKANDLDLFSIISNFDTKYTAFNDFQTRMNRYWSLRWIEQEKIENIKVTVVKGDLVRLEGLPMMQRVPGLPEYSRGQNLLMKVVGIDYIELVLELRLVEVLDQEDAEDLSEEELVEVEEPQENPAPQTNSSDSEQPKSNEAS